MKTHSTNYKNTFILIADDCPAKSGEMPATKGEAKTIAGMQFDMVYDNPYKYSSDDVFFSVFATKNEVLKQDYATEREKYFSVGRPCFRASPLTKRYGWGVHSDSEGKIAIYGCETEEYQQLATDPANAVVKAMKTSRGK